jgi:hypothetical protein
MTAMGIRFVEGATCTGVLIPVTDQELLQFDQREAGYDRVRVPTQNIQKVPFLNEEYYHEKDESGILNNLLLLDKADEQPSVWIYQPQAIHFPHPEKPIVQTYVDTILRGCLEISEEFAVDFLTTTRGWSSLDLGGEKGSVGGDLHAGVVHWVNDRLDPIYLRADQDWILESADNIDRLLQIQRPKEYPHRKGRCQ